MDGTRPTLQVSSLRSCNQLIRDMDDRQVQAKYLNLFYLGISWCPYSIVDQKFHKIHRGYYVRSIISVDARYG